MKYGAYESDANRGIRGWEKGREKGVSDSFAVLHRKYVISQVGKLNALSTSLRYFVQWVKKCLAKNHALETSYTYLCLRLGLKGVCGREEQCGQ